MIKVKLELDKLTSMLVSHHILCIPTDMTRNCNQDVFDNLTVTPEEKEKYLNYILSRGIPLDKTDWFRLSLFSPADKNLDDFLKDDKKEIPEELKKNIISFQQRFEQYFEKVKAKVDPLIQSRTQYSEEMIDKVYESAKELSGVYIEKPKELEVRIVEGLSPSSMGVGGINGKKYIIEQAINFLSKGNWYLLSLIHEAVAHQTAKNSRKYLQEKFGGYVYDIEEGFAKLFTKKIAEKILNCEVIHPTRDGLENLSYDAFNKNWDSLNENNFENWYQKCLTEIKDTSQK